MRPCRTGSLQLGERCDGWGPAAAQGGRETTRWATRDSATGSSLGLWVSPRSEAASSRTTLRHAKRRRSNTQQYPLSALKQALKTPTTNPGKTSKRRVNTMGISPPQTSKYLSAGGH